MSKGCTIKHEMISVLTEKKSFKGNSKSYPPKLKTQVNSGNNLYDNLYSMYQKENEMAIDDFSLIFDKIPSDWVILSISVDLNDNVLYLARYEKSRAPIIIHLGLNRNEECFKSYNQVFQEFDCIISESNATLSDASSYSKKGLKSEWWNTRRSLDKRLKLLLDSVEGSWFGCFRGIFSTSLMQASHITLFKTKLDVLFNSYLKSKKNNVIAVHEDICSILLRIGDFDYHDIKDFIMHVFDTCRYSGMPIDYGSEHKDLNNKISALLKEFQKPSLDSNSHLILIPDKNLQRLPWESIPILRQESVCRLPSFSMLKDRLIRYQETLELKLNSVSYVLNPTGDLINTQKLFQDLLKMYFSFNLEIPIGTE